MNVFGVSKIKNFKTQKKFFLGNFPSIDRELTFSGVPKMGRGLCGRGLVGVTIVGVAIARFARWGHAHKGHAHKATPTRVFAQFHRHEGQFSIDQCKKPLKT